MGFWEVAALSRNAIGLSRFFLVKTGKSFLIFSTSNPETLMNYSMMYGCETNANDTLDVPLI